MFLRGKSLKDMLACKSKTITWRLWKCNATTKTTLGVRAGLPPVYFYFRPFQLLSSINSGGNEYQVYIGSDLWEYTQQWKRITLLEELFVQRLQIGGVLVSFCFMKGFQLVNTRYNLLNWWRISKQVSHALTALVMQINTEMFWTSL